MDAGNSAFMLICTMLVLVLAPCDALLSQGRYLRLLALLFV